MDKVKSTPNDTIGRKTWSQVDTSSQPQTRVCEFWPSREVKLTPNDAKRVSTSLWSQVDEAKSTPNDGKRTLNRLWSWIDNVKITPNRRLSQHEHLCFPWLFKELVLKIYNSYSHRLGKKYGHVCACMDFMDACIAVIQVTYDICLR